MTKTRTRKKLREGNTTHPKTKREKVKKKSMRGGSRGVREEGDGGLSSAQGRWQNTASSLSLSRKQYK